MACSEHHITSSSPLAPTRLISNPHHHIHARPRSTLDDDGTTRALLHTTTTSPLHLTASRDLGPGSHHPPTPPRSVRVDHHTRRFPTRSQLAQMPHQCASDLALHSLSSLHNIPLTLLPAASNPAPSTSPCASSRASSSLCVHGPPITAGCPFDGARAARSAQHSSASCGRTA